MQVYGIKYGLRGFYDRNSKPVHLTPEMVDSIQLRGGTILVWFCTGTSPALGLRMAQFIFILIDTYCRKQLKSRAPDPDPGTQQPSCFALPHCQDLLEGCTAHQS